MTDMKECRKCKQVKPTTEFYKAPRVKDGLGSYCKKCTNDNNRKSKVRNKIEYWNEDGYEYEWQHFNDALECYARVFNCPQLLKHKITKHDS